MGLNLIPANSPAILLRLGHHKRIGAFAKLVLFRDRGNSPGGAQRSGEAGGRSEGCNDLILRCVMGCFWKIYAHYFFKSYSALQEGGYSLLLEIATAFLAWEISWTEEPGGLQSTGSQNMTQRLNNCYIRLFTIAQGHTDSVHYFFSLFLTVLQFPQVLLSCLPLHFSLSLFFKLVN